GSPGNPVHRKLDEQLTVLFDDLLKENVQEYVTFQVSSSYDYPINPAVAAIPLPVFMQPPMKIRVIGGSGPDSLAAMISNWTGAIQLWAKTNNPVQRDGELWFDLIAMSNLTASPMPLLRLRNLKLETQYITGGL